MVILLPSKNQFFQMYLPTLFSISLTIQCCYWSLTLATLNRGMRKTLHGVALAQADCEIHCGDLLKDCQKMASNIHTRHLCSDYNHHCHQYCKDISHNITQQAITDASSVLPSNLLQCYTTCGQGLTQCSILAADSHEHKKCSINYYQCIDGCHGFNYTTQFTTSNASSNFAISHVLAVLDCEHQCVKEFLKCGGHANSSHDHTLCTYTYSHCEHACTKVNTTQHALTDPSLGHIFVVVECDDNCLKHLLNCGKSSSHSFAVHQCEHTYHQCMHDCGNLNISHHLVSPSPSTPQKPMTTAAPITGITQTKTSVSATTKTTETTTQQPTVKTTKLMWVTLPTNPHGK